MKCQEDIENDSITWVKAENKRNIRTVWNVYPACNEVCSCTGLFPVDQCEYGIYVSPE